jgi:hypothetical protein
MGVMPGYSRVTLFGYVRTKQRRRRARTAQGELTEWEVGGTSTLHSYCCFLFLVVQGLAIGTDL